MPPAPPTFSTITWLPRASDSGGARIRATTSTELPAAPGATMVTARVGHVSASVGAASDSGASAPRMTVELARNAIATVRVFGPSRKAAIAVPPMDCEKDEHVRVSAIYVSNEFFV